jgi:hypothetical protein
MFQAIILKAMQRDKSLSLTTQQLKLQSNIWDTINQRNSKLEK